MGHCCCFTYSLVCSTDSLPRLVRLHSHVVLLTLSALGCDAILNTESENQLFNVLKNVNHASWFIDANIKTP